MSLINQMLQDIDARRSATGAVTRWPQEVRPLPKARPSRRPAIVAGLVLIVVAMLALALPLHQATRDADAGVPALVAMAPPAAAPVPLLLEPVVLPATHDAPLAVDESVLAESLAELDPAPEPIAPPPVLLESYSSLRMADTLAAAAEKKVRGTAPAPGARLPEVARPALAGAGEPVIAPMPPAPVGTKASTVVAALNPSLSLAEPPARPVKIEKTEAFGSPGERAESEYRKAIAVVNQGRVSEALAGLRSALAHDGYHVGARQLLAKLLLEAGRGDEAIALLHEGVQAQPAQLGWAMSLARLQLERRDVAAAWQTLNYSLPAAGRNADYQGFAAHVLQRLGRNKEAAEHYQAAARLAPADGRWWLGLGLALEAEGRSPEAHESFVRARSSGTLGAELSALVEQKLR